MQLDDIDDLPPEFKGGSLKLNENIAYNEQKDNEMNNPSFSKEDSNRKQNKMLSLQQNPLAIVKIDDFFTFRQNIITSAIEECNKTLLIPEIDGLTSLSFLLTQISHWDADKERLVLLTNKTLIIVKYDFIAMKILNFKKISLDIISSIIIGDLIYPSGSLVPYFNGIADGISMLQNGLFDREKRDLTTFYRPRNRNMYGLQLNLNEKMDKYAKWNPFKDAVPYCTFTAHPLFFSKDEIPDNMQQIYDFDEFIENIRTMTTSLDKKEPCLVHYKNIILESYLGLTSVIHNRNLLGFFKVRGKISF